MKPSKPKPEEVEKKGLAAAEARLHNEMMACERKCEGGGGALPVARSAVPAGTRARLLLMYTRLVMGGRLRARRWELWPERKVGTGRNARVLEAGYPAQLDLEGRIRRARELELGGGVERTCGERGTG